MFPCLEKGLCRCCSLKDLKMRRSYWIMKMGLISRDKCPHKRKAEADLRQRRLLDYSDRGRGEVAIH